MDINSLLGLLTSADSVGGLSQTTNVSSNGVQSILGAALPSLLTGALNQSTNAGTAASFTNALTQHSAANTSNLGSFFGSVDTDDGAKIVNHLLGDNAKTTIAQIAKQSGVSQKDTAKVLSAAAPLLMSLLGQQANTQQVSNNTTGVANMMSGLLGNADMTSLLGAMLGAGTTGTSSNKKTGGLLGALLGFLK